MNNIINQAFKLVDGKLELQYGFNSGGYEYNQYFITSDGGVLSIDAVIENYDLCNDESDTQWFIIGSEVNYEDDSLYCDHTGNLINPAYSEVTA